jgi:hypothetical protein
MPEDSKNKTPLQLKLVVDEKDLASKGTLDKAGYFIVLNQGDTAASFTIQVDNTDLDALNKKLEQMNQDINESGKKLTNDYNKIDAQKKSIDKMYSGFEQTKTFTTAQSTTYNNLASSYKKQQQQYTANYAKYEAKKKNYEAKTKQRDKILETQKETLKSVRWIWNVCKGKPDFTKDQYRKDLKDGVTSRGAKMPKVLEGGGLAWIEGFLPESGPANEPPNGYFVAAKGTPKILGTHWRVYNQQNNGAIIDKQTKKFREAVQLHIYTQALYGQDLNVELYDTKYFNASLAPLQVSDADRKKDNKAKVTPKALAKYFQREVKLYPLLDDEKAFVTKIISNYDDKATSHDGTIVQKAIVDVFLDELWRFDAGEDLQVHAIINTVKKDADEYENSDEYIQVAEISKEEKPAMTSNTPVIQGDIEVNASNFKPCKYTGIELNKEEVEGTLYKESEKKVVIYREDSGVSPEPTSIKTGVIFGSKVRAYNITLQELQTNSHICLLTDPAKHPGKTFTFIHQPENITDIKHNDSVLSFKVKAPPNFVKLNYIWPSEPIVGSTPVFSLSTNTCRHSHHVDIGLHPDIGWSLKLYYTPKYAFTSIQDISYLRPHAASEAWQSYQNSQRNDLAAAFDENMAVKLGFKLECTFDGGTEEFTKDFIDKIWKTVSLFGKMSNFVNDICHSPGLSPSTTGVGFTIKQTALGIVADWKAVEKKDKNGVQQVGVDMSLGVEAKPLVGAEITIDLLKMLGNAVNPGVGKVISALKDFKYGDDGDDNYIRSQLKFDLIFSGDVNLSGVVKFNTVEEKFSGNVNGNTGISVKAVLSYKASGKVTFIVTGEVEGEASVSGEASVTGGVEIGGEGGFYILPIMKFNGLLVKFVFKGSVKGGGYTKAFDASPKEPITILPPYPKSGDSIFSKMYPFK